MHQQLQRVIAGALLAVVMTVNPVQAEAARSFPAPDLVSDPVVLHGGPVRLWNRLFAFLPFWHYANGASFALTNLALRWSAGSAMEVAAELTEDTPGPITAAVTPAERTVPPAASKTDPGAGKVDGGKTEASADPGKELTYHMLWWQMGLNANRLLKAAPQPAPPKPAPEQPALPKPAPKPPVPPKPAPEQPAPPKPAPEQPAPPKPAPKPPVPPKPAPEQPAPEPEQGLTPHEQEMVDLVNAERAKAGLPALQVSLKVTEVARLKSADMVEHGYFSHQSPTYGSPFEMLKQFNVSYGTAGENIAGNGSVTRAHTSLMNSPGHRANILGSRYTHVGIGIVKGGPYGMMFTQLFVGK